VNVLIRNGAGIRFASSTPAPITNATEAPATTPAEEASFSAASTPSDYITSLDSATDFTSESLYNIPEHIGYLKSLGLDYGYGPTSMMEWTLEHIHIFAGTPWCISIALTAVLVRAVLFKLYIGAAENSTRLAYIMPTTKPITDQMRAAQKIGDTDTVLRLRRELSIINKRAGIHLWKSFVPLAQGVAGFGTFMILRAMAKLPVPGLETGGVLWFHNLTLPDPYFILPFAAAVVLHWVLRVRLPLFRFFNLQSQSKLTSNREEAKWEPPHSPSQRSTR
jgi:YidC/Oxa1 family membrane protein insertase